MRELELDARSKVKGKRKRGTVLFLRGMGSFLSYLTKSMTFLASNYYTKTIKFNQLISYKANYYEIHYCFCINKIVQLLRICFYSDHLDIVKCFYYSYELTICSLYEDNHKKETGDNNIKFKQLINKIK